VGVGRVLEISPGERIRREKGGRKNSQRVSPGNN